jgi:cytidine deaminase
MLFCPRIAWKWFYYRSKRRACDILTSMTTEQRQQLIDEAMLALKNCYPKDRKSSYAAAVLTDSGIYSAASYDSDTGSLTLHGEQSTLAHAAAHGQGAIYAMAVTSTENLSTGEFTAPCHMCKQLLWESRLRSGVPMLIILANNHGETKEVYIDDLMPLPWPRKKD